MSSIRSSLIRQLVLWHSPLLRASLRTCRQTHVHRSNLKVSSALRTLLTFLCRFTARVASRQCSFHITTCPRCQRWTFAAFLCSYTRSLDFFPRGIRHQRTIHNSQSKHSVPLEKMHKPTPKQNKSHRMLNETSEVRGDIQASDPFFRQKTYASSSNGKKDVSYMFFVMFSVVRLLRRILYSWSWSRHLSGACASLSSTQQKTISVDGEPFCAFLLGNFPWRTKPLADFLESHLPEESTLGMWPDHSVEEESACLSIHVNILYGDQRSSRSEKQSN